MLFSFAHLWQQAELSDVAVLLTAPSATADQQDASDAPPQKLAEFPGHTALLSSSPYLKAQILRWQRKRPHDQSEAGVSTRRKASAASSSGQQDTSRPQLVLALQDASEQPAAMAILAAMYGAKPVPELLSELSQEQQLQAAIMADMWQLPAISTAAAGALADTLSSMGKLSDELMQQLSGLQAVPDCLRSLLKQVLLPLLGNLERCWSKPMLKGKLLQLPLSVMEVLLSFDELKVASEDTVLYTVRRYMACASDAASKQRIRERLGPLIRCQHLSLYWLMLSAFSEDAGSMPLAQLQPQLKPLVMLRNANPRVTASELKELLKYPPSSWLLAPRSRHPVSAVQLTWELDVSKLREAAQRSAAQQEECRLTSPGITPPLGGVVFGMVVVCKPEQVDSTPAVKVGLDAVALGLPHDASCCVTMKMSVAGVIPYPFDTQMLNSGDRLGWDDLLDLGPMAGGWDEVGWASKGLPTSGPVVLKLSVTGVGHMARTDTDAG